MTTKDFSLSVISGPTTAQFSINDQEIGFGDYLTGINMAVIDGTTGYTRSCTSFNTPVGTENSDALADLIETLPSGTIVALAVKENAGTLSSRAITAIQSLGSQEIDQLQPNQSYALIGSVGNTITVTEQISDSEVNIRKNLELEIFALVDNVIVEAISEPSTNDDGSIFGGVGQIIVNGQPLIESEPGSDDWYMVVLDPNTKEVKHIDGYDPINDDSVNDFVAAMNGVLDGEIVAIATQNHKGESVNSLLIEACSSIGATMLDSLGNGGSWTIVSYKGASSGEAVENYDNISSDSEDKQPVKVKYWNRVSIPMLELRDTFSVGSGNVEIYNQYLFIQVPDQNSVVFYELNAEGQWEEKQTISQGGPSSFGEGIGANSKTLAIGFPDFTVGDQSSAGRVYIYEFNEETRQWGNQQTVDNFYGAREFDKFGEHILLHDPILFLGLERVILSSEFEQGSDRVYNTYELYNGEFSRELFTPISLPSVLSVNTSYYIGQVDITSQGEIQTIAVGINNATNQSGFQNGAVYIYRCQPRSNYIECYGVGTVQPPASTKHLLRGFGYSVAIDENFLMVNQSTPEQILFYQLEGTTYRLDQIIDYPAGSIMGPVAMRNNIALAPLSLVNGADDSNSQLMVFAFTGGKWEHTQTFGYSGSNIHGISFDGQRAAVSVDDEGCQIYELIEKTP